MGNGISDADKAIWLMQLAEELKRLRSEADSNGFEPVGELLEMVQQEVSCMLPQYRKS